MTLRGDEDAGLGVAEDVVLLENAAATVEDADAAVAPVMDLVLLERGIRVGLDPNARHRIVENLVLLQDPQAAIVDENPSVLTAPYLVSSANKSVSTREERVAWTE